MLFYAAIIALAAVLAVAEAAGNPLWPLPSSYQLGNSKYYVSPRFAFRQNGATRSDVLARAFSRYEGLIGKHSAPRDATQVINSCSFNVKDVAEELSIGVDESYTLDIKSDGSCSVTSMNTWGALRALETFSQLLLREDSNVALNYVPVTISDSARFAHRGLLVDTSRHYLPVETLKTMVDALVVSKFNVLHWHTVDAESFPLDSPSAPNLVKGAYSPKYTYTMDTLSEVTQYARDRGVNIIYELDVPGHAASWTAGARNLMADCFVKYSYNINDFALNPTLEDTYSTINAVLSDIVKATKTPYLHLGGDEVVYGCWNEDKSITQYMADNGITSFDQLMGYFVGRVDTIANNLKATAIHWEEVFKAGAKVPADTIFQVWTDSSRVASITSANYKVIASPSNYWYLDHSANTWKVMYGYDPIVNLTSSQAKWVIGGEVAMWGEYVDENNLESSVYPRACAVGERLWSPSYVTNQTEANDRLLIQRCRMVQRGFHSAPVQPGFCPDMYV